MKEYNRPLEDIFDVKRSTLSLDDIERLAKCDDDEIERFKQWYVGNLFSSILSLLTNGYYPEDTAKLLWDGIVDHLSKLNETPNSNVSVAMAAMDYLANNKDTLPAPLSMEERVKKFAAEFRTIDKLTGLFLRDVFDIVLRYEVEKAITEQMRLSLILMDIDDFKVINDTYGHEVGDKVLKEVGAIIKSVYRRMDTPARYGGEELALITPSARPAQVFAIAERIRQSVAQLKFDNFSITISIGVSRFDEDINTAELLIKAAENALHSAKNQGKNCIVIKKAIP